MSEQELRELHHFETEQENAELRAQIVKTVALLEALADDSDWEWHVPYMGSSLSEHDFERVHCIRESALRRTIEQIKEVLS